MRKNICFCLSLCLLVCIANTSHAAHLLNRSSFYAPADSTKSDSTKVDSTDDDDLNRMFMFGLEYASDQAQHGLHNDIKIPYLEPSFTYMAPKGFYIALGEQYILAKKKSDFDAFSFNPGWDIDFGDNTSLNFSYTHYIFGTNTPNLVKSSLSNSLETYVSQWIGDHLKAKLSVDYDIYKVKNKVANSPNDICFTPDLTYKFKWKLGKKSSLKFKPEVSVDLGTRNFYTQYINAAIADSTAKGIKTKEKNAAANSNSSFGTLDYNVILTLDLAIGKFDFEPAFNYTKPLYQPSNIYNPAIGYVTLAVTYTIETK